MAVPFYLQGSQTAGLLGGSYPQSSIPSMFGGSQQYVPGFGMPLYADPQQTSFNASNYDPSSGGNSFSSFSDPNARNQAVSNLQASLMQQGLSPERAFEQANSQISQQSAYQQEVDAWNSSVGTPIWDAFHGTNNTASSEGGSGSGGGSGGTGTSGGSSGGSSGGLLTGGSQLPSGPNVGGFPNFQTGGVQNYLPLGGQPGGQVPGSGQPGSGGQAGAQGVPMMQMGPQNALDRFTNTAGYQLTEGAGAGDRFQASPGYQFAVNEALKQVQQNAAARGLLGSGAALRALTDRAQGMAQQEYGNWQNRQQQLYGDYQNRLAGLAGGPTGAEQAYGLGQGQAQLTTGTGQDIASLLANQGSSLFGGITGTGAAQAGNVMQAGGQQASILSGNQATNLAAAAAKAGGLF